MHRDAQLELADTLLGYAETNTTYTAGAPTFNPVTAYTDVDRWQHERALLAGGQPVVVALSAQLVRPGDWVTFELPDLPVLAVRGDDGRARCFLNACRHRGAMLVGPATPRSEGATCGHARSLVCPFHAWSYRLDGSLGAIPDRAGFTGIDATQFGLVELPCTERAGLLWARRGPSSPNADDPAGVDSHLGAALLDELASYGFEHFHHFRSTVIPVAANWKLMYDTFLEFYHGVYLHPSTLAHLMLRNLVHFDRLGEHWRMAAAKRSLLTLHDQPRAAWQVLDHAVISYDIFPNLAINFHGDQLAVYRVLPGPTVGESYWHYSMLTPEPVTTDKAKRYYDRNFDYIVGTGAEDVAAAQSIEKTLRSGALHDVCFGGFEPVLSWFHDRLAAFTTAEAGAAQTSFRPAW